MASPTSTKIPVGTILSDKYKVTREIGRGGMAAVYEAENIGIGKRVAIKVLAQELTASTVVVERFFREARAAAAIRSPYICDVYDSGRLEEGPPFLVLELLEGESLYERMTKVRYFDIQTTLAIATQVCRGLTKAHAANIVHRDLKPENIFIGKDEDGALLAKILDFGLAKFYTPLDGSGDAKQQRLTREGAVFGTPAYMSPEQVRGQGAVDHRADLWALACIVYECFTGRTVWQTEQGVAMTFAQIASAPVPDPLVYRPDLPPSFKDWFERALDRRIDQRFQTAKEFSEELVGALDPAARLDASGAFRQDTSGLYHARQPAVVPPQVGEPREFSLPPPPPTSTKAQEAQPALSAQGATRGSTATFEAPPRGPSGPTQEPQPSNVAQDKPSRGGTVVLIALLAAALGVGGVFAWSKIRSDQQTPTGTPSASAPVVSAAPSASAVPSAKAQPEQPATPLLPWRTSVSEAQDKLKANDHKGAFKALKEAFDKGGHGVPRTMLDQVQVAINSDAAKSPCSLTGLGRPRTYDLQSLVPKRISSGRPHIALGSNGPVVVWTDAHEGPEHAFAAVLNDSCVVASVLPYSVRHPRVVYAPEVGQYVVRLLRHAGGGDPSHGCRPKTKVLLSRLSRKVNIPFPSLAKLHLLLRRRLRPCRLPRRLRLNPVNALVDFPFYLCSLLRGHFISDRRRWIDVLTRFRVGHRLGHSSSAFYHRPLRWAVLLGVIQNSPSLEHVLRY